MLLFQENPFQLTSVDVKKNSSLNITNMHLHLTDSRIKVVENVEKLNDPWLLLKLSLNDA